MIQDDYGSFNDYIIQYQNQDYEYYYNDASKDSRQEHDFETGKFVFAQWLNNFI